MTLVPRYGKAVVCSVIIREARVSSNDVGRMYVDDSKITSTCRTWE